MRELKKAKLAARNSVFLIFRGVQNNLFKVRIFFFENDLVKLKKMIISPREMAERSNAAVLPRRGPFGKNFIRIF
jgi:hypothetical protein